VLGRVVRAVQEVLSVGHEVMKKRRGREGGRGGEREEGREMGEGGGRGERRERGKGEGTKMSGCTVSPRGRSIHRRWDFPWRRISHDRCRPPPRTLSGRKRCDARGL